MKKIIKENLLFIQRLFIVLIIVILALPGHSLALNFLGSSTVEPISDHGGITSESSSLRIPFIQNHGQIDNARVSYYANIFSGTLYVTENSLVYSILEKKEDPKTENRDNDPITLNDRRESEFSMIAIEEQFVNAQGNAHMFEAVGKNMGEAKVSYFKSGNEDDWKRGLPVFEDLDLGHVWKNVSVSLKAWRNNVEKIFTVHPKGDPMSIRIKVGGADALSLALDGSLVLHVGEKKIAMTAPVAFQLDDSGQKIDVAVKYRILGDGLYSFDVGGYDVGRKLVIDPLLAGTFLGGSGNEEYPTVAVGGDGSVYVLGVTQSANFPMTLGEVHDNTHNGVRDFVVSKFNNDLSQLLASTYVGGSGNEYSWYSRITVDQAGNVYFGGRSLSSDYPVTPGVIGPAYHGGGDFVLSKLNSDLSVLLASTYVGGSGSDDGGEVVIDNLGNVYISIETSSNNIPVTDGAAFMSRNASTANSAVFKLSNDLTQIISASYMHGMAGPAIALDSLNNIFIAGTTGGSLSTTAGAYSTIHGGGTDIAIAKFNNDITQLLAATYLGGSHWENNTGQNTSIIAIDAFDNVYIGGETQSSDFPTTPGAFSRVYNGYKDAFISKMSNDLTTLLASTYLGGENTEEGGAIALDSMGNVYYTAYTDSSNIFEKFPTTPGAYMENEPASYAVGSSFVSKLSGDLGTLLASTYLGGPGNGGEYSPKIAIDSDGNVFIVGSTADPGFPTNGYEEMMVGSNAFFIAKLDSDLSGPRIEHLKVAVVDHLLEEGFESGWDNSVWTTSAGLNGGGAVIASALQADGKIIIGGYFTSYNNTPINNLARLNPDGSLDDSFNPGIGPSTSVSAIAIQSDGKIVIGGSFTSYNLVARNRIARVNTDGSLDTDFNPGNGAANTVSAIAIQSDGKIVIGGSFTSYNLVARNRIARVNTDGSLDTDFNPGNGAANTVSAIAIQSDGKIVIGGSFTSYNLVARNRIARVNTDGSLDTDFNPGNGAANTVSAIAIQSDGKIVIGGNFLTYNLIGRVRVARINTNGSLDMEFDPGTGPGSAVNALNLDSDGKVLIGGAFQTYAGAPISRLARLNNDASLDASFDPGTGADGTIFSIKLQSDEKLVIGGAFKVFNGSISNVGITRLEINGSRDMAFNEHPEASSWRISDIGSLSGSYSLHSAQVRPNDSRAWLMAEYDFPEDGQLSFYWKTSTDVFSPLKFCLNIDPALCGVYDAGPASYTRRITGDTDWTFVVIPVSAGRQQMQWYHERYNSSDEAWLDELKFSSVSGQVDILSGGSREISIRAIDSSGGIDENYSGDRSVTFFGLSDVGGEPSCVDKDGFEVPFGLPLTISFSKGLASTTLTAYTVENALIGLSDGLYDTTGDASYGLNVFVGEGEDPVLSAENSSLVVAPSPVLAGAEVLITLVSYDVSLNPYQSGGHAAVISVVGANSFVPLVTDHGDGTYTATYTPLFVGTDEITATINGSPVGNDSDGVSDGTFHLLVNADIAPAHTPADLTAISDLDSIQLSWDANGNPAGTEYFAENFTLGTDSGWTEDLFWQVPGLACGTDYMLRVKARNIDLLETAYSAGLIVSTLSCPQSGGGGGGGGGGGSGNSGGGGGLPIWALDPPLPPADGEFKVTINSGGGRKQTTARWL
jgi:uncharacterized delta-60 repeat protein